MIHRDFLRLNSASTEDMLTDAAVHVLAERGPLGLAVKPLAEWLRVTPQRVTQMARSGEIPRVVAARYAGRWIDWIDDRRYTLGPAALLPSEATEVPGLRVWLALRELSRNRPDVAELLTAAVEQERRVVARACPELEAAQVTLRRLLDLLGVGRARAA